MVKFRASGSVRARARDLLFCAAPWPKLPAPEARLPLKPSQPTIHQLSHTETIVITGIVLTMSNHGWGNNPEPGGGDQKPGNNNQGPPDLEEVWRDFNRRLRIAFGGKGG